MQVGGIGRLDGLIGPSLYLQALIGGRADRSGQLQEHAAGLAAGFSHEHQLVGDILLGGRNIVEAAGHQCAARRKTDLIQCRFAVQNVAASIGRRVRDD